MCFLIPASPVRSRPRRSWHEDGGVSIGQVVDQVRPGAFGVAVHVVGQAQVA